MTLDLAGPLALVVLVFARVGAALMLLPVFGEGYVLARARLVLALMLAVLLAPVLAPSLPAVAAFDARFAGQVVGEVVRGLFIGAFVRLSIAALSVAGTTFAMQMGFAQANFFNPAEAQQSSAPGNLFTAAALVTLVLIDGHHALLDGLVASYASLPPTDPLAVGDMAAAMARGSADAVALGFQMALPMTVASIVLYALLGMMNRLVPTLQVIFVAMSAQILVGLAILGVSLGAVIQLYADFVADLLLRLGG